MPNPAFQTTPQLQRRTTTSRTQALSEEEEEEEGLCHEVRLNFVKGLGTVDHASKGIKILWCASSVQPMHSTLTLWCALQSRREVVENIEVESPAAAAEAEEEEEEERVKSHWRHVS